MPLTAKLLRMTEGAVTVTSNGACHRVVKRRNSGSLIHPDRSYLASESMHAPQSGRGRATIRCFGPIKEGEGMRDEEVPVLVDRNLKAARWRVQVVLYVICTRNVRVKVATTSTILQLDGNVTLVRQLLQQWTHVRRRSTRI